MKIIGVIPARYESSRFQGKPLADICGKPMIWWVYQHASQVKYFNELYVATDDQRIYDACAKYDMKCIMTSTSHRTGTDRIGEVAEKIPADLYVNIQGDEPFIQQSQIETVCRCFEDADTQIATLGKPFTAEQPLSALENPNSPKLVVDNRGYALYFSRSIIPFLRGIDREQWMGKFPFMKHIGLYAYRTEVLHEITQLPQSSLELAESLEQLRWLQNGYRIKVGTTEIETVGIDTPEDLERAEEWLKKKEEGGRTKEEGENY